MNNNSIWMENVKPINTNKMTGNIEVDILIIGAGMTGINTAYFLKDSNKKIALIERNKVGMGVSSLTTGKITYLQNDIYSKLEKNLGYSKSFKYLKSQQDACKLIKDIIDKNKIDCNYEINDSILFAQSKKDIPKIKEEQKFFEKAGIKIQKIDKLPNNYNCVYGIKINDSAVFNSVKYIRSLANICLEKNVKIYENVCAHKLKKEKNYYLISTNKYEIKAKKIIVATHYPFFILPMLTPLKTHLEKSHLLACKVKEIKNFNAITNVKPTITMRYYKDKDSYFIFGGETYNMANNINYLKKDEEIRQKFEKFTKNRIIYDWSICDLTTNDYLPFIGALDGKYSDIYIATGYNKWGMTNSVLAGKIISDLILNRENIYIDLFDPKRSLNLFSLKNQLIDNFNMGKIFLKTKVNKNKNFYNKSVKIIRENGISIGIYTDKDGIQHKVHNLCPHMKCSLIFNEKEKCWDCPCHSSKFDIDGNCIKGPSVYSIKIKESDD